MINDVTSLPGRQPVLEMSDDVRSTTDKRCLVFFDLTDILTLVRYIRFDVQMCAVTSKDWIISLMFTPRHPELSSNYDIIW